MVPRERLRLIVAADWREFAGFAERRPVEIGLRWSFRVELADGPALLAAHGAGRDNAGRAVEAAAGKFELTGVVSTGFAGGLDPALEVGEVFVADQVFRLETGVGYSRDLTLADGVDVHRQAGVHRGTLVTIDEVAQTAQQKRRLRGLGADAVDMEAAEVARRARSMDLPFHCVRVISDAAETDFSIDFNRARRADGTFSGWSIVRQAGLRPRRWKDLFALKQNSDLASQNLARFLTDCRFIPSAQ